MVEQSYKYMDNSNEDDREKYAYTLNSSHNLKTENPSFFPGGIQKWIIVHRKNVVLSSVIFIVLATILIVVLCLNSNSTNHSTTETTSRTTCVPQSDRELFDDSETRIFNSVHYKFVRTPRKNWTDAVNACARTCSVLTSIRSAEEYLLLKRFIDEENSAWIGGTIMNRTRFEWIENNEPVPDYIWRFGEPNNSTYEQCIDLYNHRITGANDNKCDDVLPFICKIN